MALWKASPKSYLEFRNPYHPMETVRILIACYNESYSKGYQPLTSEEARKEQSWEYEESQEKVYWPNTVNDSNSVQATENLLQDENIE